MSDCARDFIGSFEVGSSRSSAQDGRKEDRFAGASSVTYASMEATGASAATTFRSRQRYRPECSRLMLTPRADHIRFLHRRSTRSNGPQQLKGEGPSLNSAGSRYLHLPSGVNGWLLNGEAVGNSIVIKPTRAAA